MVSNEPSPRPVSRLQSMPETTIDNVNPILRTSQSLYDQPRSQPIGSTVMTAYAATKFLRTTKKERKPEDSERLLPKDADRSNYGGFGSDHKTEKENHWMRSIKHLGHMITGSYINILLLVVPFAVLAPVFGWSDTSIFLLNFLSMMPLASLLGEFTEEVAAHTNQMIGGLINATFGNAVEVVVALQALAANQIRVVQASLMGSVFSNMLLVLGCCFFFGGIRHSEQTFNSTNAVANLSLLMLSSLAIVLPTPLADANEDETVLLISRYTGIFLLFMYFQLMFFQLRSHAHIFESMHDEEEEPPELSMPAACLGLLLITLAVAYLSELLVDSIDGFTEEANLTETFVGMILLPIIGNAVEHVTAVSVAMKNKMELAMGVAIGSATQISMLVVPVVVIAGWIMNKEMTLSFYDEEVMLYVMSVIIVTTASTTGRSNWLLGSLLITTYILVGLAFWFED